MKCVRSVLNPNGEQAGYLVDTGDNHRSGVDQGTDRCWTLHSVGQPDVQWEHGTLTGTADEHQEQCGWHDPCSMRQTACQGRVSVEIVVERTHIVAEEQDTDEEEQVGKTRDDKRLLGSVHGSVLGIVEADKQVRAYTHELPEEIHLEDVGGHYQSEHTHGEERQESIEALEAFLVAFLLIVLVALSHVAEAIDVNHHTHRGDDNKHHHADRSQTETDVERQSLGKLQPCEVKHGHSRIKSRGGITPHGEEIFVSGVQAHTPQHSQDSRADHARNRFFHLHAKESEQEKAQERQKQYQE